ncbi:MAG: multiubiquitin domain-containing protein [Dehalococcoidia bacterium]|jgi:hypothetical protein|nr:multiubiquitin domain-containing protein [Dehalococcoidia bacterium]MCZ7579109.1 multiubiquitin domain-containing protein [Dehalococcoidia bacterium]
MSETSVEVAEERHDRTVTVTVNNRAVELDRHRVTGLEIKQAAIAQGVPIQLDFQLAEIRPNGEHQIIGDGDVVTVTRNSKFVATAADDNS